MSAQAVNNFSSTTLNFLYDTEDEVKISFKNYFSKTKLGQDVIASRIPYTDSPVGALIYYPSNSGEVPEGFIELSGQTLQISDYPELFEVYGTKFGRVTKYDFKLPDFNNVRRTSSDPIKVNDFVAITKIRDKL